MSKGGSDAPSPDPAIGAAALAQAKTGEQWLAFAKDAFATSTARQEGLDALSKQVTEQQLGIATDTANWAREDRASWEKNAKPLEERFYKDAAEAGNETMQNARAAEAAGDIQTAAASARGTATREAGAAGIRPGSGRYSGIDKAGEIALGLGSAGAQNQARTAERARGDAMRGAAIDLGNTSLGRASANLGTSLQASSAAYGTGAANQQISMMPAQNAMQGYAGAMQGYQGQANTLSNLYGIQMQGWAQEQQNKSNNLAGLFSAIGTIGGAAFTASDKKGKKNIKATAKGSGLKAIKKMPISKFDYKPGVGDGGAGHTGTMSHQFAKATGRPDIGGYHLQDAVGITMKAIQDLDAKVDKLAGAKSAKSKSKKSKSPAPRRSTQSPTKARNTTQIARPQKPQQFGIRRA